MSSKTYLTSQILKDIKNKQSNKMQPKNQLSNSKLINKTSTCKLFKLINKFSDSDLYTINISKSYKIEIKEIINGTFIDIDYKIISNNNKTNNIDNKILLKILRGLYLYTKSIKPIDKYKQDYEIEKSVLYIWLLPTKVNDIYIVKIGYSKDLTKRKSDLCKTFGIDDMQLIFCISIKNEAYEKHIHNYLKEHYIHLYIATEKLKNQHFVLKHINLI